MSTSPNITVIGIGSPNGDDAIGWRVIDQLEVRAYDNVRLQKLDNPLDMLDVLDSSSAVHVVDAAVGLDHAQLIRRLDYSKETDRALIEQTPVRGTHDMSVDLALEMARSLGKRIDHVTVWVGNAECFGVLDQLSGTASESVNACVAAISAAIAKEQCHA